MALDTSADRELAAPVAAANTAASAALLLDRADGRDRARAAEPAPPFPLARFPEEKERPYWFSPLLALIALSVVLGSLGLAGYRSARDSLTHAVAGNLESVAKLKSFQIDRWLENAASGLKTAVDAPQFAQALLDWEGDGRRDGERRSQLQDLLKGLVLNSHYVEADLRSAQDGALLLATSDNTTPADAQKALAAAPANAPVLDGFHADASESGPGERVHVGFFYPWRTRGSAQALAVVHVELDPTDMLAQLAQEWPSLSRSAETILVRRDGSDVVFLTPVRDLPRAKSMMRMPLARPDFVEAEAAMGESGYLSGLDYGDDAVLAFALRINDAPWFIVAKIDQAEVYAKIRAIAVLAAAAVGALVVLGCGWWATRRRFLMAR